MKVNEGANGLIQEQVAQPGSVNEEELNLFIVAENVQQSGNVAANEDQEILQIEVTEPKLLISNSLYLKQIKSILYHCLEHTTDEFILLIDDIGANECVNRFIAAMELVKEGKIKQEKLDQIIDRTKKGGAEIVKYLEKGCKYFKTEPDLVFLSFNVNEQGVLAIENG